MNRKLLVLLGLNMCDIDAMFSPPRKTAMSFEQVAGMSQHEAVSPNPGSVGSIGTPTPFAENINIADVLLFTLLDELESVMQQLTGLIFSTEEHNQLIEQYAKQKRQVELINRQILKAEGQLETQQVEQNKLQALKENCLVKCNKAGAELKIAKETSAAKSIQTEEKIAIAQTNLKAAEEAYTSTQQQISTIDENINKTKRKIVTLQLSAKQEQDKVTEIKKQLDANIARQRHVTELQPTLYARSAKIKQAIHQVLDNGIDICMFGLEGGIMRANPTITTLDKDARKQMEYSIQCDLREQITRLKRLELNRLQQHQANLKESQKILEESLAANKLEQERIAELIERTKG